MIKLIVHHVAKAELRKARRWYDKRQPGLGIELLEEVQKVLSKIEHDPLLGIQVPGTPFRFNRVKRFPYVIYYQEVADHYCVMAIAHERRRPGYWRHRRPE